MTTTRQKYEILALALIILLAVPTLLRKSGLTSQVRLAIGVGIAVLILILLRMLK
ncbi:hypothetical protein SAMN05421819_2107 [Bryocella elongata]|uniref:Uncharacterized protein n=1 Tax=Bryocella elongata TaxID=863522 RepID=A0A1H5Y472_9BACT|nr:hypothetical protein [Bryocella elongata]SEG18632.1 hypothetical protein SAMN05421819_2107 [Bryocella elongata]